MGGRRQYQAKLEEKEKPAVTSAPVIKEEVKGEEPVIQEEEEHEDEKPKRGRKQQQVYRVKGASSVADTTAKEGEAVKEPEEAPEKAPKRSKSRPSKPQMVYRRKDEVAEEVKGEEETKEGEEGGDKKKKSRKGD